MITEEMVETLPIEQERLKKETGEIVSRAKSLALAVRDDESYQVAGDFLKQIKGLQKKVLAYFEPMANAAHKTWKEIVKKRDEAESPLLEAETALKRACVAYYQEQERKAQIEQSRLQAEAKKKAEDEQLRKAQELQARGEKAAAAQVLEQPTVVESIEVKAPVKSDGLSYQDKWSATVTDIKALVKAVAEGKAPMALLQVNEVELRRLAKALKTEMNYPGVQVNCEKISSARAK